jgi:hypothetical protein
MVATATDKDGNTTLDSRTYTMTTDALHGFYRPVAMGEVWNTVRVGSAVPFRFEVFDGDTELASSSAVSGFAVSAQTCPGTEPTRPSTTSPSPHPGGHHWATTWSRASSCRTGRPRTPGACYRVTMTTRDGSTMSALFALR